MNEIVTMQLLQPPYTVAVQVIRSPRRRTISLQIRANSVSVRVPVRTSRKAIESVLVSKQQWLSRHLQVQLQKPQAGGVWQDGSHLLWLGEKWQLQLTSGRGEPDWNYPLVHLPVSTAVSQLSAYIGKKIAASYCQRGMEYCSNAVAKWGQKMGLNPNEIALKSYTRRWGSCDSRGKINFNWRLLMAPAEVVDSVVVHELAHLRYMNHSADFYRLVEEYMPEYRRHNSWLKQHGDHILLAGIPI